MISTIEGLAIIVGMAIIIYILSYKEKIQSRVRARSYRKKRLEGGVTDHFQPTAHKSRLKIPGYYDEPTNGKEKKYDEIELTRVFM